jgi:two-component system OmpR family sensor kinase
MFRSLRGSLLFWYTSILVFLTLTFGAAVCYVFWRSLLKGLDEQLGVQAQAIAHALQPAGAGTFDLDLPDQYFETFSSQGSTVRYYAIWNEAGGLVDQSNPALDVPILAPPASRSRHGFREVAARAEGGATVLVGQDTAAQQRAVWSLAATVAAVGMVALALSLVGGWFLAGRVLAPIARISRTAQAMLGGDFSARIAVDSTETELGQVASALNAAFDRLRLALDRQQRFTADASHELRTPLATLSAEVEWAQNRPRSAAEYQASLDTCRRAATRMRSVVEGLLTLARADAGEVASRRVPVSLVQVVHEVVALLQPLAEKRHVSFSVTSGSVEVVGDPDRLRELVMNLVSNAVWYNRENGRIDIAVRREAETACLEVADTGIGIAPEDLPRIFDRFYRADRARAREAGGAGLGLAVARWVVDSHGGEITCASEIGRGTRFVVRLPASPATAPTGEGAGAVDEQAERRPDRQTSDPSGALVARETV